MQKLLSKQRDELRRDAAAEQNVQATQKAREQRAQSSKSVPIEGEVSSPSSLSTEELITAVVSSFSKIRDAMPYVFELRKRFADAPKGAADIAGCNTWEEFCQKHLHRTPRAIQMALQDMKAVPCELCGEMLESKKQLSKHKHKKHPEIAEAHRNKCAS